MRLATACKLIVALLLIATPVGAGHIFVFGSKQVSTWKSFDENNPARIASNTTGIWYADTSTGAGDNEFGQGLGLSTANLTWTQSGNIAGVTSTYRYMDSTDDYLSGSTPLVNVLAGTSTWTIIHKLEDTEAADYVTVMSDSIRGNFFVINRTNQVDMLDDRSAYEVSSTTDTWTTGATGGVVYIAAWADGTNKVRWGHTSGSGATRFTKWSQIKGTCRKELVNVKEWPSATTGAYTATDWLNYGTAGQQSYMKWHYTIISTECLIEND